MVRHTRESGPKSRSGQAEKKPQRTERIAKRLARAGVASRREVERLIGLGLVAVNGRILATPAVLVGRDDVVTVEGKVIGAPEATRLWRYHKPAGLLTTNRDPKDRATVFEHLPEDLPRVVSVGRLDLNSEGLLLFTNDGGLARALELPANAWRRVYRARALGRITQAKLDTLKDGIVVEGVSYGSIDATLDKAKEKDDGRANVWITVALNEGKNREVRRVLEALGLKVNRLLRLAYGPFQLGTLAPGDVEEVGPRVIREQLAEFIAPENLPSGARTATPAPNAGRRPGSALADPRRKPSRVRADEAKAAADALEREAAPKRPARDGEPDGKKSFGAKPRREGGFGERKASGFGEKRSRSEGGFGAKRPRDDRATGARKASGFGEKRPRSEGGYGGRKSSSADDRPPRRERPAGARKSVGFGEKRSRGEEDHGDRKPARYGEKKPRGDRAFGERKREGGDERRGQSGFGRDKPRGGSGEGRPFKRRDDARPGFGEKRERPAGKGVGEKRERPAGKRFGKPGGKPGGFKKAGGRARTFAKAAPGRSERSSPSRGPKPAGRPGPRGGKPHSPKPRGPKRG